MSKHFISFLKSTRPKNNTYLLINILLIFFSVGSNKIMRRHFKSQNISKANHVFTILPKITEFDLRTHSYRLNVFVFCLFFRLNEDIINCFRYFPTYSSTKSPWSNVFLVQHGTPNVCAKETDMTYSSLHHVLFTY